MNPEMLVKLAVKAKGNAYSIYSGYKVGAALLCNDEKIYTGCNIENASFGATICAERVAFCKAISEGKREFTAIAIVGAKDGEKESFFPPCGICRQFMREFCGDDFLIILGKSDGTFETKTLGEIFPYSFSKESLNK